MDEDKHIKLVSIYAGDDDTNFSLLYQLLAERERNESISHHGMPTFQEHVNFIRTRPYKFWGLVVQGEGNIVGSIYLSHTNEIGIAIFKRYRRNGYGKAAIKKLLEDNRSQKFFIANINPLNIKSITMFKDLGFHIIQETYRLDMEGPKNVVS